MTASELIHEAQELYREKGLECSEETLDLLQGVCRHLRRRGIRLTREVLDYNSDVFSAGTSCGMIARQAGDANQHYPS